MRFDQVNPQPPPIRPRPSRTRLVGMGDGNTDWTIGFPIPFGTAIFGYTVYNVFYILPTPPGQVGSNEAVGLLVFGGLLHLPPFQVTAMFIFSHPWAALLMCVTGLTCLSSLGLTISSALKVQTEGEQQ